MAELTVGDLVAMRQLGCQTIAGAGGLDRQVVWAHSCELTDPWNWLSADELLMTTGISVPPAAAEQVDFVRRLADAGIAGVAVGDDQQAPPLTDAMLAEADSLNFPVVAVTHATPFSAIGRTVAVARQSEQISRIARLSRLYEAARSATLAESSLLERLSSELGYELHVIDVTFGTEVLPSQRRIEPEISRQLRREFQGRVDRLPPRVAVKIRNQMVATAFPLPTHRTCMVVVTTPSDITVDAFQLMHAQSLIGIEVERDTRQRERDDVGGSLLFQQIMEGTLGSDAAQPRFEQAGLADQEWVVVGFDAPHLHTVQVVTYDSRIPRLTAVIGEEGYLLLASEHADTAADLLGEDVAHLGVSTPTTAIQRLPDCVRQARWALHAARADGSAVAAYSTASPLFLPRTLTEAQFAARAILGTLIDYDAEHQSSLVDTLEAFLSLDRSWAATADQLLIHRQTLAYRLKKIEAITGRTTRSSADIAFLWMALTALRISRGQA